MPLTVDSDQSGPSRHRPGFNFGSAIAFALVLVFLVGLGLRLHHLTHRSLTNDEILVLWGAQGRFDGGVLKSPDRIARGEAILNQPWIPEIARVFACNIAYMDVPPGYFLGMFAWLGLVPPGEFSLRFPSCVAGGLSVLAIYLCARKLVCPEAALATAALVAIAPTQVLWAQENREYAWTVLVATLLLWRTLTFRDAPSRRNAIHFALVGTVAVLLQYGLVILLGAASLYILREHRRHPFRSGDWLAWKRAQYFLGGAMLFVAATALLPQLYFHRRTHLDYLFSDGTVQGGLHYLVSRTLAWPGFIHGPMLPLEPWGTWLPAGLFALGLAAAARSGKYRGLLYLFAVSMLVTAAGGLGGVYPYGPTRHSLFQSPFFYLVLAALFDLGFRGLPEGKRWVAGILAAALITGLGTANVLNSAARDSEAWRQVRPVAHYLAAHRKPGEPVHASHLAYPPLDFYLDPTARTVSSHRFPDAAGVDEAYGLACLANLDLVTPAWLVLGDMAPAHQKKVLEALRLVAQVDWVYAAGEVWLLKISPATSGDSLLRAPSELRPVSASEGS